MKLPPPRAVGALSLLVLSMALLSGCAAPQVTDYAAERPTLDLREYFNGPLEAYGVFTDRSGKVVKRFTVAINGHWQGPPGAEIGTLDEHFSYSDGSHSERVWTLRRGPGGGYTGTAGDVLGQAVGRESGNAFHWNYTLKQPIDGHVIDVQMDDWLYLMTDKVMLNKTQMSKFGINLGEATLSFVKR